MEKIYQSLKKLFERYVVVTGDEIQGFLIFQVTYEIIYHYYHRYCVIGYKGVERILDLFDHFENPLSDDAYNDILRLLIVYMNEEKKVQKEFLGKTFQILSTSILPLLLELLNGKTELLFTDLASYIYVKATLFNVLKCCLLLKFEDKEGSIIYMITDELLLKLIFLHSNQKAIIELNQYFVKEITSIEDDYDILSVFVQAITKHSRMYNNKIEPKLLNKIFDSFHNHLRCHDKNASNKEDDINLDSSSSIEVLIVEIVRRDFPFDQLDPIEPIEDEQNESQFDLIIEKEENENDETPVDISVLPPVPVKINRSNWQELYGPTFSQSQQENNNLAQQLLQRQQKQVRKRKYSENNLTNITS